MVPLEIILDCRYVSVFVRNALCMVMYNYALKFLSDGTKSLTLKYFVVKKLLSDTLRDENILPRKIFTRKYPVVNYKESQQYTLSISHGMNYPTYQTYKEARYLCCSQFVYTVVVLHLTSTNTLLRLVPTT